MINTLFSTKTAGTMQYLLGHKVSTMTKSRLIITTYIIEGGYRDTGQTFTEYSDTCSRLIEDNVHLLTRKVKGPYGDFQTVVELSRQASIALMDKPTLGHQYKQHIEEVFDELSHLTYNELLHKVRHQEVFTYI